MAVLGEWGALLGLLIVFGLFGLLVGSWVFFTSFNERANREIVVEGNLLRLSKREVPIDQVMRFTAFRSTGRFSTTDASIRVDVAKVEFDVRASQPDGTYTSQAIEFCWVSMGDEELKEVVRALKSVLPGKWVPRKHFRRPPRRVPNETSQ